MVLEEQKKSSLSSNIRRSSKAYLVPLESFSFSLSQEEHKDSGQKKRTLSHFLRDDIPLFVRHEKGSPPEKGKKVLPKQVG